MPIPTASAVSSAHPSIGPPSVAASTEAVALPLTPAQTEIWLAQRLRPADPTFNTGGCLEIPGPLLLPEFVRALRTAVGETECLRTRLIDDGDRPAQIVADARPVDDAVAEWLRIHDLRAEDDPDGLAFGWMHADLAVPRDITTDRLFDFVIFLLPSDRILWYQNVHHLRFDGHSGALFLRRVAALYSAALVPAPPPATPFGPLAVLIEQIEAYRDSAAAQRDRAFWRGRLDAAAESAAADLPAELGGPGGGTARTPGSELESEHGPIRWRLRLSPADVARLSAAARAAKVGWSVLLLSALAGFLAPATGPQEVTLGLVVKGRAGGRALSVPGMTSDVLPLRLPVSPWRTLGCLAGRVAIETREVVLHQRITQRGLRALRDPGAQTPLFGTTVNINRVDRELRFAGRAARIHQLAAGRVAGLNVDVHDGPGGGIDVDLVVDSGRCAPPALAAFGERLAYYLRAFVDCGPERAIAEIGRTRPNEAAALDDEPIASVPERTLSELFDEQVLRSPTEVAIDFEGRCWTYAELAARVNRLARLLVARGVGPERVVAIALPRTPAAVVAMLAVTAAGGAFLPIDPELPAARIRAMLDDARPTVLITDETGRWARREDADRSWTLLDQDSAALRSTLSASGGDSPNASLRNRAAPHNAAYLIYTSGSTGRPKGVVVEHRGLAAFAMTLRERCAMTPGDRVLRFAAPGFDAVVWELLQALTTGATLVLADAQRLQPGPGLTRLLSEQRISHLLLPPSAVAVLMPDALSGVRCLVVGGEACPPELVRQWASGRTMINAYGPTEATVCATMSDPLLPTGPPTVGRAVAGMRVLVLDAALRPVPTGTVGEVYLAGPGLARGYLNEPALTAQRFPPAPSAIGGGRMYRTGDLGFADVEGRLQLVGRADAQVKIRGIRVELGEIEAVLVEHPMVASAAVVLRTDQPDDPRLHGFVRPVDSAIPTVADLREHCANRLPRQLVPSGLEILAELPRTPAGKVDRRALTLRVLPAESGSARFVAPQGSAQERVARMWREVLGRPVIGAQDNFFDLGGHSLSMARLHTMLVESFGTDIALADLYSYPTVAGIAALACGEPQPGAAQRTTGEARDRAARRRATLLAKNKIGTDKGVPRDD